MSAVLPSDIFTFEEGDGDTSPSNALFPPSLSFPGLDDIDNTYLSPNSLSPHSSGPSSHPSLSPPATSDSPSSSLSFATDEYLLNNSFGADELDMLIFPEDTKPDMSKDSMLLPFQPSQPTITFGQTYDNQMAFDVKPGTTSTLPTATMGAIQPPTPVQSFDGLLHQWRMDLNQNPTAPWLLQQAAIPQQPPAFVPQGMMQSLKDSGTMNPPPRRSAPNAPINKPPLPAPPANVGKHNKTERRYRQKVQQAQADLRDAVPALRVLYGTSTEEQKKTTDIRAADGTVDGLGEVTRPNASAKATILIGARMYIELLQQRTAMLQRKVAELEGWRSVVGGQADLDAWLADFESREAVLAAQIAAQEAARDDDDDGGDSEEEEAPRKRKRTTKATKADSKVGASVRTFAAFAMSFSLMPSATKLFKAQDNATSHGAIYTGDMSSGQILRNLPLLTAEHGTRLLNRALPSALVPDPHSVVDWTLRILATILLAIVLGPLLDMITRRYQDKKTGAGNPWHALRDFICLHLGQTTTPSSEWNNLAARIVGGSEASSEDAAVRPPLIVRYHVATRLRRSPYDPYSLALSALMFPGKQSSLQAWSEARSKAKVNSPLSAVLALPLDEATRCLELVPPSSAPIASIAEQINLVHLYDLYSRFFTQLVTATGGATSLPPMLANIQKSKIASELNSLDREIRGVLQGVPKHSASHALSLVLLGLWGLFSGYQSPAALVSALAGEEVQGAGASLASVSAMLELLYPGSSNAQPGTSAPVSVNAQAIDKLAMACIGFVDLLFSSSAFNNRGSRMDRLEANLRVQKEAARLRLVLTEANFVSLDEESADHGFDATRQKMVSVLCSVGRRAAGRTAIRDDDSGLEDELDD